MYLDDQQDNASSCHQVVETAPAWERKPDESVRAYEAFKLYLHSETRRLAEVAEKLSPACSVSNVARWSLRHNWPQRAFAFDKEEDRRQQAEEARDRTAARKRHLQISQHMQAIALQGLLEMKAKIAAGQSLGMTPSEIETMMSSAIKIERLVLGEGKDRRQYTDIKVFVGEHKYPGEPGYGHQNDDMVWKEMTVAPIIDQEDHDEGKALPEEAN